MRLVVNRFYRLSSGSVALYLGLDQGRRAFLVKGRRILVKLRNVEGPVLPPSPKVPGPRRIPFKRECKGRVSSRRTHWASQKPWRQASVKAGNARPAVRCSCLECVS